ncbi:MAG: ABC transporter substrate-binding protein [Candidatus Alcyoniella australis]|nr:ABC transporter substrate-binding protein [Candidatus Alcyoniella australis]
MRTIRLLVSILLVFALLALVGCGKSEPQQAVAPEPGQEAQAAADQSEVILFSWWTAGGEAEGLQALVDQFNAMHPQVKVINAAVAGGAGTNAKAVLMTRMMGGDPPDSFQVHGGAELLHTWVEPGLMQPLTALYDEQGWREKFPAGLIQIVSAGNEIYAVPANIHRGNVLWYNARLLADNGIEPPTTLDEFFAACDKLKAAGVTPLALSSRNKWPVSHLFETLLLGVGGPEFYRDLFAGKIAWTDERVKGALQALSKMVGFANSDHAALTWDQASGKLVAGQAAFNVMGDWAKGYFMTNQWQPGQDFGAIPSPGTDGMFIVITDTFGIPKDAPHAAMAREFLKVVGSAEGQTAFNLKKGSIPARVDAPADQFDQIAVRFMSDFAKDTLVPSCAHGSAVKERFATALSDELSVFIHKLDVDAAALALEAAAKDAGVRPE